jgi:tryptophan 2,3-dioxygenase
MKHLTYGSYLRLEALGKLQKRSTRAHDEMQFIIVHQVFELWFKLLVFELESVRAALRHDDPSTCLHLLGRIHTLVQAVTQGIEVIETMRPYDFMQFRDQLRPASGFQSVQFREIEFVSGLRDERFVRLFDRNPKARRRLKKRLGEPSIWDEFVRLLGRRGYAIKNEKEILGSILKILRVRRPSELGELLEALVRYDELFSIWRRRHVTMIERMIGSRAGTGERDFERLVSLGYSEMGQGGAAYLRTTLEKKFFPLLWQARTRVTR